MPRNGRSIILEGFERCSDLPDTLARDVLVASPADFRRANAGIPPRAKICRSKVEVTAALKVVRRMLPAHRCGPGACLVARPEMECR